MIRKDILRYFSLLQFIKTSFVANVWSVLKNVLYMFEKNVCVVGWNALYLFIVLFIVLYFLIDLYDCSMHY